MKTPNSVTSSEIVASNEDLLIQILLLLPIKSLIRFKSVNKNWLSLITNHSFSLRKFPFPNPPTGFFLTIKHQTRFNHQYISLYPNKNQNPPPFNFNFTTDPSKTEILHSCNGLLLCCSSQSWNKDESYVINEDDCSIYVYNPTTSSKTTVLDNQTFKWCLHGATLVFDPRKSPHYKVVLVMFCFASLDICEPRICEIRVLSSETGLWTDGVVRVNRGRVSDVWGVGVYWNGSVHWLSSELYVGGSKNSIRFDVDKGLLVEMPSPPVQREYKWNGYYYFGESCDHLQFVENLFPVLDVYEMRGDYSEWFVRFRVDVTRMVDVFPEVVRENFLQQASYVGFVLSLVRGEDDKEMAVVLRIPGKVVKFNVVDGTSVKLWDCEYERTVHKIAFVGVDETVLTYEFRDECGLDYIQSLYSC